MLFKSVAVALLSLSASVLAAPLDLGISMGKDGMPVLNLPYASYKARYYDRSDDYYHFTNIRFAAPPTGALRWKRPQPPLKQEGIQDGTVGYQCYQALPKTFSIGLPFLEALEPSSEDCLFLDIRVPGKAVRGEVKNLPVLFWIFGGGYAMGSKSFFLYDGHPFLNIAKNNIIWVAPNYRLGAFGWLNGPIPQAEGVANLGIHDQRAALQWVQNYIGLLNGDKTQVTAMGESAGAGSIMHHLVAEGGTVDPLFKRAIMQSPAFEPLYSRSRLHTQYEAFASLAGCGGKGLDCLRSKPVEVLQAANIGVVEPSQYGTFGFGPGVDHSYIRDLPAAELAAGKYWKDVEIITGHTSNEGYLFSNPTFTTNKHVEDYIAFNFQNTTAAVRQTITGQLYPAPGLFKPYSSQFERTAQMVGEFVCTCNVRALVEAYANKAYAYVFSAPPGIHGLDLVFTFWRTDLNIGQFQLDFNIPILSNGNLATLWQSYLVSFARSGDPNKHRQLLSLPLGKTWSKATAGAQVNALDLNFDRVNMQADEDTPRDRCNFWNGKSWRASQD